MHLYFLKRRTYPCIISLCSLYMYNYAVINSLAEDGCLTRAFNFSLAVQHLGTYGLLVDLGMLEHNPSMIEHTCARAWDNALDHTLIFFFFSVFFQTPYFHFKCAVFLQQPKKIQNIGENSLLTLEVSVVFQF